MDYNETYHLNCELELDCGRKVILQSLNQAQTYRGMLGGHPSDTSNDSMLRHAIEDARQQCVGEGAEPFLISPKHRNFKREPGDMDSIIESRARKVEWIPLVRCIGIFSSSPALDVAKDISHLTIIWYQDHFAMPIDSAILLKIKSVDWTTLATDVELN